MNITGCETDERGRVKRRRVRRRHHPFAHGLRDLTSGPTFLRETDPPPKVSSEVTHAAPCSLVTPLPAEDLGRGAGHVHVVVRLPPLDRQVAAGEVEEGLAVGAAGEDGGDEDGAGAGAAGER